MNPQEALQVLDQISATVQLNREGHVKVQTAINTLAAVVHELESQKGDGEGE